MTWETMEKRFNAAKMLTSLIKRHMEMKQYNKDELILKNAKLEKVNDLLDQSIKEQKISEKSKKIKKAVLEIKRFWSEDGKKEAQTKAENSIGVKVKALQDKQLLLQQQQKKAEDMFEIEQEKKAKGIGNK
jgi:hypothetical protein